MENAGLLAAGAAAALVLSIAAVSPVWAQASGEAVACSEFRFTDPTTGRGGTVCLPIAKETIRSAAPSVYCERGKCIVTARRTTFKPGVIGAITDSNGSSAGGDVCIIYKILDPGTGKSGELCIAADLSAGDVACVPTGSGGDHCVMVQE